MSSRTATVPTEALTLLEKAALMTGRSVWETRAVPRLGIRSLWLADGPHGVRRQVGDADHLGIHGSEPATCFPTAATVANSWDPELAEEIGRALGAEAAAQDVDVLLGPGLNIKRSPLGGRGFEYFSEDPVLSGKLAAGYVRGIQSHGVAACPKHFAANSQELRRMVNDSVVDERTLREIYLTGFEIVVQESAPRAIMSAYNLVNGVYANENAHLLQEILRDEWGFAGAVVTDWGGSNDIVEGVRAGSTLEMPAAGLDSARQLVAAVEDGRLPVADLDARVAEIRTLVEESRAPGTADPVDQDAHHALARRAAARSAVLLKNDGSRLPLAPATRVAVVGDFAQTPRYQGAGSSAVNPTRLDSVLDEIGSSGLVMTGYAQGFRRGSAPDATLVAEAVEAARGADVVLLFLGLDEIAESEGLDRSHLRLPEAQTELLAAVDAVNPEVVVVLSAGGVVEMPWVASCRALVHGYLAGQAGAGALLDVLTGTVAPSGRLAETVPLALSDTPSAQTFPGTERTAEYREGLYVGYRYYTTADVPVVFPFGFGLSYTTFEHSDLVVSEDGVQVTVRNTGDRDGADVVQVYVHRTSTGVHRPDRELKGFARVDVPAGGSVTVTVPLDAKAFRHFDVVSGTWQVEEGDYEVLVGASVDDIRLTGALAVRGTKPAGQPDPALPSYLTGDVRSVGDAEFAALLGRPVPQATWTGGLGPNDALGRMRTARSPLARLAYRVLAWQLRRSEKKGTPDLNTLFLLNMPFRAIAKMTNGAVSTEMVGGIVRVVNGHLLAGGGTTARGFVRNLRANRRTARALRDAR